MDLFTALPLVYLHTYICTCKCMYVCIALLFLYPLLAAASALRVAFLFSFFFSSHKPSALHIVRISSASLLLVSLFFANRCLVMHMERAVKFSNG